MLCFKVHLPHMYDDVKNFLGALDFFLLRVKERGHHESEDC